MFLSLQSNTELITNTYKYLREYTRKVQTQPVEKNPEDLEDTHKKTEAKQTKALKPNVFVTTIKVND